MAGSSINRAFAVLVFVALGLQGCQSSTQPKRFGANLLAVTKAGSDYNPAGLLANRHVRLFSKGLSYPPAGWYQQSSMRNMHGQSEHFLQDNGHRITFGEVPIGETFESPSQLYAIDARISDFKPEGEREFGYLWRELYYGCQRNLITSHIRSFGADVAFFCEQVERQGGEKPIGVMTVTRLITLDEVEVELSYTWTGAPFLHEDEGSWPVSKKSIEEAVTQIGFAQLVDLRVQDTMKYGSFKP